MTDVERTQKLIDQLCECLSEDNCVRAVMQHGYSYEIHEIPWDRDTTWYIGFDPHGTIVALELEFDKAVKQAERYLNATDGYEQPAKWKEFQLATVPQKDYLCN